MCLAIPGKIETIEQGETNLMARANFGGITREICLDLTPEAKVGDYVLVHVGYSLSILNEKEAQETVDLLQMLE